MAPALGPDGTIYAQTDDHRMVALSPTGAMLWDLHDSADIAPIAVAPGGTVYASDANALLAVNPDGTLSWRARIGNVTAAAPVPDGGVIAGVAGGPVIALSPDGAERWSFTPAGGFSGRVAIADGLVHVGSASGTLYTLDLSGAEVRHFVATASAATAPITSGPVAGPGGVVYFGSDRFYALSPDGAILWRCDTEAP